MTNFEFLNPLEDIIVDEFNVLDDRYARDMAKEVLGSLVGTIEHENEIRYLLIDRETAQLESRRLYETFAEAEQALKQLPTGGNPCLVGTLIIDG